MSDHATTTNDNDADTKTTSFMDLFALHLAARLVGREHLENQFKSNTTNDFQVYWKSPILCKTRRFDGPICCTASSLPTTTSATVHRKDEWNVVFVDVTSSFNRIKNKVTIVFSMMLQQHDDCAYVSSAPLSYSQLTCHSENIGIDIESTKPDAIARSMGDSLLGMVVDGPIKLEGRDGAYISNLQNLSDGGSSFTMPVCLSYKELQETDSLKLSNDTACVLNTSTSFMVLYNLESNDNRSQQHDDRKASSGAKGAAELTTSFEKWWNEAKQAVLQSNGASKLAAMESSTLDVGSKKLAAMSTDGGTENVANGSQTTKLEESITHNKAPTNNHTSTMVPSTAAAANASATAPPEKEERKRPPVKRPHAGYARVNPKKKKRGKLTFAKANK